MHDVTRAALAEEHEHHPPRDMRAKHEHRKHTRGDAQLIGTSSRISVPKTVDTHAANRIITPSTSSQLASGGGVKASSTTMTFSRPATIRNVPRILQ